MGLGLPVPVKVKGLGLGLSSSASSHQPLSSPDTCSLLSPPRLGPLPQSGVTEGPPQAPGSGGTWVAVPLLPPHNPVLVTSPKVLIPRDLANVLLVNSQSVSQNPTSDPYIFTKYVIISQRCCQSSLCSPQTGARKSGDFRRRAGPEAETQFLTPGPSLLRAH